MSFKIESLYAYVTVGNDGEEGVVAAYMPQANSGNGAWLPLVAADLTRMQELRHYAEVVASQHSLPVNLVRFTTREELETL